MSTEGEKDYVSHFAERVLDGSADEVVCMDDILYCRFKVTDSARMIFPDLKDVQEVWFYERPDGTVCECDAPEIPDDPEAFDEPLFSVIEYSSGFVVAHNPTGQEAWMSDGVDALYNEDGEPISPGTKGFTEKWAEVLNADVDDTLNAYFPELVDDED